MYKILIGLVGALALFAAGYLSALNKLESSFSPEYGQFKNKVGVLASAASPFKKVELEFPVQNPASFPTHDVTVSTSQFERRAQLYKQVSQVSEGELLELLGELKNVSPYSYMLAANDILYSRYAEFNPLAAIQHIKSRNQLGVHAQWATTVYQIWVHTDLNAVVAYLTSLPLVDRVEGLSVLAYERSDLSQDTLLEIGEQLGQRDVMNGMLASARIRNSDISIAEAWSQTLANGLDPGQKAMQQMQILRHWIRTDPRVAMEAFESGLMPGQVLAYQDAVVQMWASRAPGDALQWVMEQAESPNRALQVGRVLGELAKTDPQSAMEVAQALGEETKNQAINSVVRGWLSSDPVAALKWFENQSTAKVDNRTFRNAVTEYVKLDSLEASRWVLGLTTDRATIAIGPVIQRLFALDSSRATRFMENISDNSVRSSAARVLVGAMSETDPIMGASWIENQEASEQGALYSRLMRSWGDLDSVAAETYLISIKDGSIRDQAAVGLISGMGRYPKRVENLYGSITDLSSKQRAARVLYRMFSYQDPDRAEKYAPTGKQN